MKITKPVRNILSVIALTGIIAATAIVVGCVSPVAGPPVVTTIPGPIVTNPPTTTGGAPIIIQMPAITVTNPGPVSYVPNPNINTLSNAAAGLAAGAGAIPAVAPYATIAGWLIPLIFGGIGTAAGYYAQAKNTGQSNAMLGAVIQGVESGLTGQTPAVATAVKAAIQSKATAAGLQPQLNTVVQKLT